MSVSVFGGVGGGGFGARSVAEVAVTVVDLE